MFKKSSLFLILILIFVITLSGCDLDLLNTIDLSEDFMGFEENNQWIYNYSFEEEEESTVTRTVTDITVENGKEIIEVESQHVSEWNGETSEWTSGDIFSKEGNSYKLIGSFYYNNGDKEVNIYDNELTLINTPINTGDQVFEMYDDTFMTVVREEEVEVPAGTFTAWFFEFDYIETESYHEISKLWFVPYVGIVKSEFQMRFWWHDDEGGDWSEWGHFENMELVSYEF